MDRPGVRRGMVRPHGVRRPSIGSEHVIDVFVYVVVLNLAAQYVPDVIAESFSVSILVAIVLKLVLEAVLVVKRWAKSRFKAARTPVGKGAGALALLVILPGSKIVVLELIAWIFDDSVKLGGFFMVTGLIVALLLARLGVRALLRDSLRPRDDAAQASFHARSAS